MRFLGWLCVPVLALGLCLCIWLSAADAAREHPPVGGCHTLRCERSSCKRLCRARVLDRYRVADCRRGRVIPCILHAAHKYRQDPVAAVRVATCESTLKPWETYLGHLGLYQFLASTWASTPYAGEDVMSAHWASLGAMWMWAHGRRGEWQCT